MTNVASGQSFSAVLNGNARKLTLAEEAQERLSADIISGRLKPDEKLGFEMLKQRYDVGVSPLREALQRLVGENLVTFEGHVGYRVAPIELSDLMDINALRRTLEVQALRNAIANGSAQWEAQVVAVAHQLSRLPIPTDPHGVQADQWEECHWVFHNVLISACTSRWTLQFCRTLFAQFRRYRRIILTGYWTSHDVRVVVDREHEQLVQAVVARDGDRAAAILEAHYDNSAARVVSEYERLVTAGALQSSRPASGRNGHKAPHI